MKSVPIKALRENLSECLKRVESGETILVTRHEKSVAFLAPAASPYLHVGAGKLSAKQSIKARIRNGKIARVIDEDRAD